MSATVAAAGSNHGGPAIALTTPQPTAPVVSAGGGSTVGDKKSDAGGEKSLWQTFQHQIDDLKMKKLSIPALEHSIDKARRERNYTDV